ncbi:MAG TPA: hypothetical protein VI932_10805 [Bacteroidota bacterium]|nr:hypothetical protein [Bacteroidota bacterium]
MSRLLSTVLVVLAASCGEPSERSVEGNILRSQRRPAIAMEFDKTLTYVGSQEFVLYDRARVDQHFFIEDVNGVIKRLYWIQFEGYLENNAYVYNYSKLPTIRIAGHEFHNNSGFAQIPEEMPEDDSDQAHATAFLYDRGYQFAREGMFQRMIWLWDESARNELMIIYVEDLGEYGYVAADFEEGGKAFDRRDSITTALLDRALEGMKISDG